MWGIYSKIFSQMLPVEFKMVLSQTHWGVLGYGTFIVHLCNKDK